ncbi:hypothetical protein DICSQDRAFT_151465 [Dichomitus squalens LYAD-421 SS1]|uniref:uncharacterized protein n=1 Tax=Dichomitus squalens (strain LYAD-421) TaxID=732165 RepID=UPI0004411C5A|nr:uncharacterized protein DICSQDRAFT_151465 [Dichomitus squalens LYAD-421 SS1]EJF67115.1 hypothetical protein DICSQDRAFT_151465 [Dichomitus squalens LYAD-421 SS1]
MKMSHPRDHQLRGDKRRCAAVAPPPNGDRSPHPLTNWAPNLNEAAEPQMTQAPSNFQSMLAHPLDRRLPHGALDYASSFGNAIARPSPSATEAEDYIPPDEALASSFSNPSSPSLSRPAIQMIFNFGPDADPLSSSDVCAAPCDKGVALRPEVPTCGTGFPEFLWNGFDGIEFPQDLLLTSSLFEAVDPLSLDDYSSDMSQPQSPSFFSRSMSRSSFGSNPYAEAYSPYAEDFPTPASDTTAVTTPAPSEACFGSPSEHPQVLIGLDFSFGMEAKKGEHEIAYVPGSAPHSPFNFSFDFSAPQAITFPPVSNAAAASAIRRHSEPASLAACHFPSFFVPSHEAIPPIVPAPADPMTHSIADNLPSSSPASGSHSAVISSIAPHQIQLPRPVEIQHPRPVRAFKPQILLSGHQYDPKDFVRRRSEPILPLPELDVASHVFLDVVPEDDEDGSMEVEDASSLEDISEDGCDEQPANLFGDDGSLAGMQLGDTLMDSDWSWLQSVSAEMQLALPASFDFGAGAMSPTAVSPSTNFGTVNWNAY